MLPPRLIRAPVLVPHAPVRSRADLVPPWKVLLHNDEEHDMLYVVESLLKAVPLTAAEAVRVMLEAHTEGVGLVIIAPQETAEYYQERIQTFGLACTIEPA